MICSRRAVAGIVLGTLLILLSACSERDTTIDVSRSGGESKFALKVKITDQRGAEYFWATNIERRDSKIFGTIDNDPNIVASVKLGDRIEIPDADIADWLYMKNGKVVGNCTVRPLFKKMPKAEVERIKSMLADE